MYKVQSKENIHLYQSQINETKKSPLLILNTVSYIVTKYLSSYHLNKFTQNVQCTHFLLTTL